MPETNRKDQSPTLESWKEIAAYLQRDVSTVRRWEKEEGLPVRRHEHRKGSSVYAIPAELDAWRSMRQPEGAVPPKPVISMRLAVAAMVVASVAASGWVLWRSGLVRLPYPLIEAAEHRGGVELRKAWVGGEVDTLGSVSPDGRYLSFIDWNSGDLKVRDLQSGQTRSMTGDSAWKEWGLTSVFSPDGKRLVYDWFGGNDQFDLRIVDVAQPEPRVIYHNNGHATALSWLPDGSQILILAFQADGTAQLGLLPADGGELRVLRSLGWAWPTAAATSPDGRWIAYDLPHERGAASHDIYLLAVDGSHQSKLVEHPANDTLVGWSPSGDTLLWLSDRSGQNDLWGLAIAEGKAAAAPALIKRNFELSDVIGLTSSGSLFYGLRANEGDVYVAEIDPASGRVVEKPSLASTVFPRTHSKPAWSPDGRRLGFISTRGRFPYRVGGKRLRIRDLETGREQEQHFGIRILTAPKWLPDGERLIVEGRDGNKGTRSRAFFLVDPRTGQSEKLLSNSEGRDNMDVQPAHNGALLLLAVRRMQQNLALVLSRDLRTGAEKELWRLDNYPGSYMYVYPSPDGHSIAIHFSGRDTVDWESTSIKLIPAKGGPARDLVRTEAISPDSVAWSADSRHVYFCKRAADYPKNLDTELWRVSVDDGHQEFSGLRMPGMNALRMHPDGRRMVFVAGKREGEIWVLEDFLPTTVAAN